MSDANLCSPCCPTPAIVEIPGTEGDAGAAGAAGADGLNSFTTTDGTAGPFDKGDTGITITILDGTPFAVGYPVVIEDAGSGGTSPGYFTVTAVSLHQLTLTYLDISANADASSIATGKLVNISGPRFIPGTLQAAMTDNSTGAASATIAAGVGCETLAFPIQLASMTTSAADLLTNYVVGYAFKILAVSFVTTTIGAGAAASQVLNLEIGTTNVTGGVVTITLAGTDTLGELTAGTAVSAPNTGSASDTLSIEVAAAGTVFTAGEGVLLIRIQNMDTANAVASFAANFNTLRTALS